jgi:hypothetical protein
MAADSCGVMGMLWGLSAGVHVSWSAVFGPGTTIVVRPVVRPAAAARAALCAWLEICRRVSQGAVMPHSRICRLASTMPTIMSCSSGRLCNAHASWASAQRKGLVMTGDLIWRAIWVTGTPFKRQCGAGTSSAQCITAVPHCS